MLFQRPLSGSALKRVTSRVSSNAIRGLTVSIASTLALGACLYLTGCNQYSENGMIGDFVEASKCPANGCANQAADPNYITLKSAMTSVTVAQGEQRAELAGDCYPSTYPKNQINVTITQNTGAAIKAPIVNTSTDAVAPQCKNGKFNLVIGTNSLPAGYSYNVRLELIGIDSTGARHANLAGGVSNVSLRK